MNGEVQQNFPYPLGDRDLFAAFIRKLKAGGRAAVVIKNTFLSMTIMRQQLFEKSLEHL